MNTAIEQNLISKIKTLLPQQVVEVEDFVEFLAAKAKKQQAFDRLLSLAPQLETATQETIDEVEINDAITAEIDAVRVERRTRKAG